LNDIAWFSVSRDCVLHETILLIDNGQIVPRANMLVMLDEKWGSSMGDEDPFPLKR
jgi:hypothetical protein